MIHIFTYGTLMFDKVWSAVVRGRYARLDGTIYGYARRCIVDEHYPAIYRSTLGDRLDGVLYLDIDRDDLARLDRFEGSCYVRQAVQVHTDNNIFVADVYVLRASYRHLISDQRWDPERFRVEGLPRFFTTYGGFDENG